MSNVIYLNQRKVERKPVEWDAVASIGDLWMRGQVLDYSTKGLFFKPEFAYVDGEIVQGDDVLDHIDSKDCVKVTIMNGQQKPQATFVSVVRWTGKSNEHGCYGFGSELFEASNKLAA